MSPSDDGAGKAVPFRWSPDWRAKQLEKKESEVRADHLSMALEANQGAKAVRRDHALQVDNQFSIDK